MGSVIKLFLEYLSPCKNLFVTKGKFRIHSLVAIFISFPKFVFQKDVV